ncbi:DNA helicase/exodeoxyribonuclease V alpha subunit [Propionicimonas paludicola]|uniref:RecBCD enzyme subunit RecD n=1 Tax=Propionicimonas paludicola TaxID=185243 RepID=A0A2A9CTB5_9ACTN|nr:exodeoxyribonuclease V subunit alpha [Propionicimonas paludicola]PFG16880.1 DNA helicase/exodeoxyribonuclease V alpha subunit [Propionicimonas paludicola]
MIDPATSLRPGLLADVHLAGALSWADVHVAQKLGHLFGESDQRVQLGLALAVRALRAGSTCLELSHAHELSVVTEDEADALVPVELLPPLELWRELLAASPLVTLGPDGLGQRPLRLVGDLLYLERYWQEESVVAEQLRTRRASAPAPVSAELLDAADRELLSERVDADQRLAALAPALASVTVVAGGPGTGKTHTLARLLAVLLRVLPGPVSIALAAPTGKAAMRMQEALAGETADLPADLGAELGRLQATTIHRLLGWVPGGRHRFAHHAGNPLPHDIVVIDETSMVNVTLMARLLEALRPQARLVLVGDPDQLAPVEAGAVLADIVAAPVPDQGPAVPVVRLRRNHRSRAAIATVAEAVRVGDPDQVVELIESGLDGITLAGSAAQTGLRQTVTESGLAMIDAARAGRVADALAAVDQHRLLCAHRSGPFGVALWSRQVEDWLLAAGAGFDPFDTWYPGRPVLVTQNNPELGVFNGDTGVVVAADDGLRVCFGRGGQLHHDVSPFLLDSVQTIHAMTVHKAQGSQFEQVSVILPTPDSPLLTRQLLYTAITRAKSGVTLIGSVESLRHAVVNSAQRASGLAGRL